MADFRRTGRNHLVNVDLVVQLRVKKHSGGTTWVPQAQLVTGEWIDLSTPCETAHDAARHFDMFTRPAEPILT